MKPGNLFIQGAKSGVRRKMRVRDVERSHSAGAFFFCEKALRIPDFKKE